MPNENGALGGVSIPMMYSETIKNNTVNKYPTMPKKRANP